MKTSDVSMHFSTAAKRKLAPEILRGKTGSGERTFCSFLKSRISLFRAGVDMSQRLKSDERRVVRPPAKVAVAWGLSRCTLPSEKKETGKEGTVVKWRG